MKFFKPEDTTPVGSTSGMYIYIGTANEKLEREGRIVYGNNNVAGWSEIFRGITRMLQDGSFTKISKPTHKALLINIEPIDNDSI